MTGGARRSGKLGLKYFVLDADLDVTVTIDGKRTEICGFAHKFVPEAITNRDREKIELLPIVGLTVGELLVTGHTLVDIHVPAAVAALMGVLSPEEAAKEAAQFGKITCGIPGCEEKAAEVARLAIEFYNFRESFHEDNLMDVG